MIFMTACNFTRTCQNFAQEICTWNFSRSDSFPEALWFHASGKIGAFLLGCSVYTLEGLSPETYGF